MRRKNAFVTHAVALFIALFLLTAAEDVQVIQSSRSTLSIYSYGGLIPSRAIPEYRDAARRTRRTTGALTDVAAIPTPAVSSSTVQPSAITGSSPKKPTTQTTSLRSGSASQSVDAAPPVEISPGSVPGGQTVTVKWNPAPEESVAGYYVYTGGATRHYNDRFTVGNETTAQIMVNQSAVYVAVSAYTAEGLESVLSDELIVRIPDAEGAALAGGGFQVIGSAVR
jgi:hypothetical protein